jgi:hypothetical protein
MRRTGQIEASFGFLLDRARDRRAFSVEELGDAAGWTDENTRTNLSKRLSELVRAKVDRLYANQVVLSVTWSEYRDLFRQKQTLFIQHKRARFPRVIVYEFFMPLTREDRLRRSLDNLFYKDTIEQRLNEIGIDTARAELGMNDDATEAEVIQAVCELVGEAFGGYSISHVSGRFRDGELRSHAEVAERPSHAGPYLVDETSAVVRFILPLSSTKELVPPYDQRRLFASDAGEAEISPEAEAAAREEARRIRWLFMNFFAEPVTKVVREDEVWLLESGMRSALHIWSRTDS